MTRSIDLAPGLRLPLDAVTQTFAILGKRGSGKTATAGVMTEQMVAAHLPVIAIDPVGVWWGLRHSRGGNGPGLPVVILGGEHADVPLEETGGIVIADFLIEHRVPAVLDLGSFSKGAQRRFMVDFAERLYHKNRGPIHLVLDECDGFIPQRIDHGGERLVGAINDLVRRGRARGIGVTLISQRPALVNKDVLTQIECLIAHRMTGPQDRDAIERWVEHNADQAQAKTVLASLQSLAVGDAWVWSPGWLDLFKRVHINQRTTFDSSATPKAGARVAAPKNPAEVDLRALRDRLAQTIEKAKADDPRELRKRIAELEKADRTRPLAPEPKTVIKEVPVFTAKELAAIERGVKQSAELQAVLGRLTEQWSKALKTRGPSGNLWSSSSSGGSPIVKPIVVHAPPPGALVKAASKRSGRVETSDGTVLDGPMRKILSALAQFGSMDKLKLALLCGYAPRGGAFNNPLGRLRSAGLVMRGEPIDITHAGLALGPYETMPDDPDARFALWMSHPSVDGPMRSILSALREAGGSLDKETLAAMCVRADGGRGYDARGGAFNNPLGRLRRLGIVQKSGPPTLAPEIRPR